MAINMKAKPKPGANEFIQGAPDAQRAKGVIRGKRRVITLGFGPETIDRIDAAAEELGISRAAWVNMVANKALTGG